MNVTVIFLINKKSGFACNVKVLDKFYGLQSYYHSSVNFKDGDKLEITKNLFDGLELGFVVLAHQDKDQVRKDYDKVRIIEAELLLN